MTTVTISQRYQLRVPKAARESLKLEPGQKLEALVHEGRLELIPLRDLESVRGFLRGIDTDVVRDADRE
ncbi:MAG: AbrB/MazE/SpoVT family DNA-binding domain-containing protein [Chromatiales bacterium]|jgi:AbrB family looped-hinge helix DNA binding protein